MYVYIYIYIYIYIQPSLRLRIRCFCLGGVSEQATACIPPRALLCGSPTFYLSQCRLVVARQTWVKGHVYACIYIYIYIYM